MNINWLNTQHITRSLMGIVIFCATITAAAQLPDYDKVKIVSSEIAPSVYMLSSNAGGNIGLFVGEDGGFLVDAELKPLSIKLQAAITSITDKPIHFIVNTHWHFDHVGGNEMLSKQGTIIVSHENVQQRMKKGQFMTPFNMDVPPAEDAELPVLTYNEEISFDWNNERINLKHEPNAHTDGDTVVYFEKANVIHTGDLYWNGVYPFIDIESGGSINGMIRAIENILSQANDGTKIIPGHGPLSNKQELKDFHKILTTVYKSVKTYREEGMPLEQVIAKKPTKSFDARWGKGFIKPDNWVAMIYTSITAE